MNTIGDATDRTSSGLSRRDFLRVGSLGGVGLALAGRAGAAPTARDDRAVILLLLVGGPSQLDTFDPKPDAPASVRGPFRSIPTRVPGVRVCEHLPRLADRLDRVAIVRSLYHNAAPIHEAGLQLLQTGRLFDLNIEHPHIGALAARDLAPRGGAPVFATLPGAIGSTGVNVPRGQTAGTLGRDFDPVVISDKGCEKRGTGTSQTRNFASETDRGSEPVPLFSQPHTAFDLAGERPSIREAYGDTRFGRSCLAARRLVEAGARMVVVNMFESVFNTLSWDCHGRAPFSSLNDYADVILPTFDRAHAALIDDLQARGLLSTTLVVATGEFGRTPRINESGGRDHWPGVWSALVAGGGVSGGQVIGASDAIGAEPADRPVRASDLAATMAHALGLDPARLELAGSARPIRELWA